MSAEFFLRIQGRLKCRGNGQCEVTVETRKRCKRCRLDKCFQKGKIEFDFIRKFSFVRSL